MGQASKGNGRPPRANTCKGGRGWQGGAGLQGQWQAPKGKHLQGREGVASLWGKGEPGHEQEGTRGGARVGWQAPKEERQATTNLQGRSIKGKRKGKWQAPKGKWQAPKLAIHTTLDKGKWQAPKLGAAAEGRREGGGPCRGMRTPQS